MKILRRSGGVKVKFYLVYKQGPFLRSVYCHVFLIFVLFIGDFIVYNDPKHSGKVSSSIPKYKKVVISLTEKIRILDKLHLDMSYSAVSHEFSFNESTIYIK